MPSASHWLSSCDLRISLAIVSRPPPLIGCRQVTAVTSSEDGNLCVVGCRDSKVYVYDIPSARLLRTLTKHGSPVLAALFTSRGNLLITAG